MPGQIDFGQGPWPPSSTGQPSAFRCLASPARCPAKWSATCPAKSASARRQGCQALPWCERWRCPQRAALLSRREGEAAHVWRPPIAAAAHGFRARGDAVPNASHLASPPPRTAPPSAHPARSAQRRRWRQRVSSGAGGCVVVGPGVVAAAAAEAAGVITMPTAPTPTTAAAAPSPSPIVLLPPRAGAARRRSALGRPVCVHFSGSGRVAAGVLT